MQKIRERVGWCGYAFLLLLPLREAKPQSIIRIQNDVVAVQARAKSDTVAFGQILYEGLFNIGTPDDRPLLYDFPKPPESSHVNLWVDGAVYTNAPFSTGALPLSPLLPPSLLPENAISCTYTIGNIYLEQRLTLEQYSDTTGAVFIQYFASNGDAEAHQIGLLLELDTNVNGNDRTPFLTPQGYSDIEQEFVGSQVPNFFQAFERDPVTPGLVAQGTLALKNGTALRPDWFVIGDWFNLRKVAWDYVPTGQKYNDSAVILRWNPQPVAPGQTLMIGTYYGLGEVTIATGQLSLNVTSPSRLRLVKGQFEPNPFDVNLIVTNTGFATAKGVQAYITLPKELVLVAGEDSVKALKPSALDPRASGTASWRVQARCPSADSMLVFTVGARAVDTPANATSRTLLVPFCPADSFSLVVEPKRCTVRAGDSALVLITCTPIGAFSDLIHLSLWPPVPGISWTFSPLAILPNSTSQLTLRTAREMLPGNYVLVVIGESGRITSRDTITVQIEPPLIPDFKLIAEPPSRELRAGESTTFSINIEASGGFADSVRLSLWPLIPEITPTFLPPLITPAVVAQLQILTAIGLLPGKYEFVITGEGGGITRQDSISLQVQPPQLSDFRLVVEPERRTINAGESASFSVKIITSGGFADSVRLSLWPSISGVAALFSPPTITPDSTANLELQTEKDLRAGDYEFVITGEGGGINRWDTIILQVKQQILPDLVAHALRAEGQLLAGQSVSLIGQIRNESVGIRNNFRILFLLDGVTAKDTLLAGLAAEATVTISVPLRFVTPGRHEITMLVDADSVITEANESNNRLQLVVEVQPSAAGKVRVRPNPFTPNGDGFNDEVAFDLTAVALQEPVLHIFDSDGVPVITIFQPGGSKITWNGRDKNGRDVLPGIYLYVLRDGGHNVASGYVVVAR